MSQPTDTLLQLYGVASLAQLAERNGVTGPDPVEALNALWKDPKTRKAWVADLPDGSRELLAFVDQIGRKLRGERLKKRWFLHGYAGFEERIDPLVERGILAVGNLDAREPLALDVALEQGLLQQWLQITPGFEGLAGDPPPAREVVEQPEDETRVVLNRRFIVLEMNCLHCARFLASHRIRLNRDGSPHRSDLKNLAPLLVDRPNEGDTVPDPNEYGGWDFLVFVLSISEALGLVERDDDELRATGRGFAYFERSLPDRLALMERALEHSRAWSELEAVTWYETKEPPPTGHGQAAFLDEGGPAGSLAGPRNTALAALRRLAPPDWFAVEETSRTIAGLEAQYLGSALPLPTGDTAGALQFVRGFLSLSLVHLGAVELGEGAQGELRARLTPLGKALLGLAPCANDPEGPGAILVDPSFEITCFLDGSPARLLHDLSFFAEVSHTSEHVVRYRLDGQSAQTAYAHSFTAERIHAILQSFSSQPIPDPVVYALDDWERLHRRVTVHLKGDVIACTGRTDPEVLQSGLGFAVGESEDSIQYIDILHSFVAAGREETVDRALTAYRSRTIDYSGPIVASLSWIDDERLRAPVGATDFRLLARLGRIAQQEEDDVFRLDTARIRTHHGDDGFDRVIALLRAGLIEGLSPERELAVKHLLGLKTSARLEPMEVLLLFSDEDGERVARLGALRDCVAQRLGPRAFHIVPGTSARVLQALTELGVDAVSTV
jgi:hypothetical protein